MLSKRTTDNKGNRYIRNMANKGTYLYEYFILRC